MSLPHVCGLLGEHRVGAKHAGVERVATTPLTDPFEASDDIRSFQRRRCDSLESVALLLHDLRVVPELTSPIVGASVALGDPPWRLRGVVGGRVRHHRVLLHHGVVIHILNYKN